MGNGNDENVGRKVLSWGRQSQLRRTGAEDQMLRLLYYAMFEMLVALRIFQINMTLLIKSLKQAN